jgi:hypothetical protein
MVTWPLSPKIIAGLTRRSNGDEFRRARDLRGQRLVDILDLVYGQHRLSNKVRFGDKTQSYIEIVPELVTLYPGAKFIRLIRNGRHVAISRIELDWERYYERGKFEWTIAMAKRQQNLHSRYARQIIDVKWHQLTDLVPSRGRLIHSKLSGQLSNNYIEVRRHRLSTIECFATESCIYRDLERAGCQLRFRSRGRRPFLSVIGW